MPRKLQMLGNFPVGEGTWELISDITIEEDVVSVTIADGLADYKKLHLAAQFNVSVTYSLGLWANTAASTAYWLYKCFYGNYLGRRLSLHIEPSTLGGTRVRGSVLNKGAAYNSIGNPMWDGDGTLTSYVDYINPAAPKFPLQSLSIGTFNTGVYIQAGSRFKLWGVK